MMETIDTQKLRCFLGLEEDIAECYFYLPSFVGPVAMKTVPTFTTDGSLSVPKPSYLYPGNTFADHDVKAASYILSVLSFAVGLDHIHWEYTSSFAPERSGTSFLFGSRSNQAVEWVTREAALGKFFQFQFGDIWSIRCANSQIFNLPDPSKLNREEYEEQTDYGVIGRFYEKCSNSHIFLVAGLGNRATEGCGYYLSKNWMELAQKFRDNDFGVVLRFPPPINPKEFEEILELKDDYSSGLSVDLPD